MIAVVLAFTAALAQTSPAQGPTGGQIETASAPQAQAPGATDPVAAPVPEPAAEKPRMICRDEQVTGTRFPIRRCRSAQQSAADRAEGQDMLTRMNGSRNDPRL